MDQYSVLRSIIALGIQDVGYGAVPLAERRSTRRESEEKRGSSAATVLFENSKFDVAVSMKLVT